MVGKGSGSRGGWNSLSQGTGEVSGRSEVDKKVQSSERATNNKLGDLEGSKAALEGIRNGNADSGEGVVEVHEGMD